MLANLEESGKALISVLHQKLEESMTENMKIQERKIQDKLGECHGMKGISTVAFSQNNSVNKCSVRATTYL